MPEANHGHYLVIFIGLFDCKYLLKSVMYKNLSISRRRYDVSKEVYCCEYKKCYACPHQNRQAITKREKLQTLRQNLMVKEY